MHDTDEDEGTGRARIKLQPREVLCLVVVGLALGAAVGYLIADRTDMSIVARVLASDAIVGLPGAWFAIIVTRRLSRIERCLANQLDAELAGYNRGYVDCLKGQHRDRH